MKRPIYSIIVSILIGLMLGILFSFFMAGGSSNPYEGLTFPLEVVSTGIGKSSVDPNYEPVDKCYAVVKDSAGVFRVVSTNAICSLKPGDVVK